MLDQTMRELLQKWDPNDLAAELMQATVSVSRAVRARQGFRFWGFRRVRGVSGLGVQRFRSLGFRVRISDGVQTSPHSFSSVWV